MSDERPMLTASEAGIVLRTFDDIPDVISACLSADGLILAEEEAPVLRPAHGPRGRGHAEVRELLSPDRS